MTPPSVPAFLVEAARAIGMHPSTLTVMHPAQARKLALQAARIHEGRREQAARALEALEAFDETLDAAGIAAETVAEAFQRKGGRKS